LPLKPIFPVISPNKLNAEPLVGNIERNKFSEVAEVETPEK
jgi:hypothetical protein